MDTPDDNRQPVPMTVSAPTASPEINEPAEATPPAAEIEPPHDPGYGFGV